jgi:hypothetical protein
MKASTIAVVLGGAALAAWWLSKKKTAAGGGRGTAVVTNPDGSKVTVPAWYGPDVTVVNADGTVTKSPLTIPDFYYDPNAYPPGVLVGPPNPFGPSP